MTFANIVPDDINFDEYLERAEAKALVVPAGAFVDDLVQAFARGETEPGDRLPWQKLQGRLDLRPREMTLWFGYKGHSKSSVLSEIFCGLMAQNRKCFVISPEFPAIEVLRRKVKQCAGAETPTDRYVRGWASWANKRLWILDKQSRLSPKLVLGVVAYAIEELGVHHILVDSLMKCGIGEEDLDAQKDFVDRLQHLAHKSAATHIHLIAHARKPAQDDFSPPSMYAARGSSGIVDLPENVVTVHLNKRKHLAQESGEAVDEAKYDVALTIESQRNYGARGRFGLYFAPGMRFVGVPGEHPRPYFGLDAQREAA